MRTLLAITLLLVAALVASAAPNESVDTTETVPRCGSGSAATDWKVDVNRTTKLLGGRDAVSSDEVYARFTRDEAGCWTIDEISFQRPVRTENTQEILLIDPVSKSITAAYEISGHMSWCYADLSKNKRGYGPCNSWLSADKPGQRAISGLLSFGKTLKYDYWREIDPERVAALLAPVGDVHAFLQQYREQLEWARQARTRQQQVLEEQTRAQLTEHRRKKEEERVARALERQQEVAALLNRAAKWRTVLELGDETHCGMIIERKGELVQVQTGSGNYWFKISQLFPANSVDCVFVNGRYLEPRLL